MNVFVARQPIFNRKLEVCAYEILYRLEGTSNVYANPDGDQATSEVIANSFLLIGIEALTGGKRAFINFTRNLLVAETATLLPKELVAVEILETIEPDHAVVEVCRKLKKLGYWLVLDDFVFDPKFDPLIDLADIIKVDFISTPYPERANLIKRVGEEKTIYLAEKIETREDFEQAVSLGYTYFQGYFFSKPVIMSGRDVTGYKLNYLQVLQEVSRPETDFDQIEMIIKRDVSLSYKLLIYINSASYGFKTKISSIKQALVLLGINEVKKWVSLISLRGLGKDKPNEIMTASIVRARFGELLAVKMGRREYCSDLFMLGMFSMLDALMDRPLSEVLADLPINDEIKQVLLGQESRYSNIFRMIISYEKGNWEDFSQYAESYQLNVVDVPQLFLEAIMWTNELSAI